MKKITLLFCVLMLGLCFTSVSAENMGKADLRWAKSLMERGDYAYAIEKFEDITRSHSNPPRIKKEAMYFMGYCYVKNNDPWQAVRVYERFLEKFDDGYSQEFIPDSLYVLGRLYEETGDNRNAIKVYRRCKKNYQGSSFARKSADRLRALNGSGNTDPFSDDDYDSGDDYTHGGNNHGGTSSGVSREIRQLLRVAATVNNSYTRDQMLLEGADRARTGEDFVALAKAIDNDYTKGQIFDKVRRNANYADFTAKSMVELASHINNSYMRDQFLVNLASDFAKRDYVSSYDFVDFSAAMDNDSLRQQLFAAVENSSAFRVMGARTVVDLANTCNNSYIHDQFLLAAAQKCPFSYRDCKILADACSNGFTKSQIMQEAKDSGYGSNNHGHRRTNLVETPVSIPQIDLSETDPFNGFKFNQAKIARIGKLVKAIESKKNMKEAVRNLKKSDLNNVTVQENMKKFRTIQKFKKIHRNK